MVRTRFWQNEVLRPSWPFAKRLSGRTQDANRIRFFDGVPVNHHVVAGFACRRCCERWIANRANERLQEVRRRILYKVSQRHYSRQGRPQLKDGDGLQTAHNGSRATHQLGAPVSMSSTMSAKACQRLRSIQRNGVSPSNSACVIRSHLRNSASSARTVLNRAMRSKNPNSF